MAGGSPPSGVSAGSTVVTPLFYSFLTPFWPSSDRETTTPWPGADDQMWPLP